MNHKTTHVRCPVCNQRNGYLRYDAAGSYAGVCCEACWAAELGEPIGCGCSTCLGKNPPPIPHEVYVQMITHGMPEGLAGTQQAEWLHGQFEIMRRRTSALRAIAGYADEHEADLDGEDIAMDCVCIAKGALR